MAQTLKNLPTMQETQVWFLDREDALEKRTATHSNILAGEIPWTEEPGGLQSMGSKGVGCDLVTNTFIFSDLCSKPGESKGLVARLCLTLFSLVGCSPPGSSVHGILQAQILEWVCHSLLQRIFPSEGSNLGLLHCRGILYCLSHQGTPGSFHIKPRISNLFEEVTGRNLLAF